MKRLTHEEYLKTLQNTDWEVLEPYINARTKLLHKCKYGHIKSLFPRNAKISNCSICKSYKERKSNKQYCEELKKTRWTAIEDYKTARIKIKHKCTNGHVHSIKPSHALHNVGCPFCNKLELPCNLYYVKITFKDKIYYKLGITTQTIKQRFIAESNKKIDIIFIKKFKSSKDAYFAEQLLLDKYKNYLSKDKIMIGGGNSEILSEDIVRHIKVVEGCTGLKCSLIPN